jgi:AraC family transcriptional regulator
MDGERQYGDALAHGLGLESPPPLVAGTLQGMRIGISHIRCTTQHIGTTTVIPPEDAFALGVYLSGMEQHQILSHGKILVNHGFAPGSMTLVNLEGGYSANVLRPLDVVGFYLPRQALDWLADTSGLHRITSLSSEFGTIDPTIEAFARCLLPALHDPRFASPLFIDHVALALCFHLMHRYGATDVARHVARRSNLARFQVQRVKEMLADPGEDSLTLEEVAQACGISAGYLVRAFRKETGLSPHQWRQQQRIENAKRMLRSGSLAIVEIALRCGFADQSHLTRIFRRLTGETPAAWRQRNGWGPAQDAAPGDEAP